MPQAKPKTSKVSIVRFIYLYLITAITFIVFIVGAVNIVDQGLKSFVFNVEEYDYYDRPMPVMDCGIYLEMEGDGRNEAYENCLLKQQEAFESYETPSKSKFTNEAKRRLSIGIAQVVVAFPLWIFHWRIIERDRKERKSRK